MEIKILVDGREILSNEIFKDYYHEYQDLRNTLAEMVGAPLGRPIPSDSELIYALRNRLLGYS